MGLTFDPRLTYSEHIKVTTDKAKRTVNILKALTSTKWGKQKETILQTYKAITRPILEYANTIWGPIISQTNINKVQIIQNAALRIATGCTRDTNIQHLHDETKILPVSTHLKLLASQFKQQSQNPQHPLYSLTLRTKPPRLMKQTIFLNNNFTSHIETEPDITPEETAVNKKSSHKDSSRVSHNTKS